MELPFERAAMHNEPMPDGLCLSDIKAFQALRWLYKSYKSGNITRDQAALEKRAIVQELENDKHNEQYLNYHIVLNRSLELARAEYRKKRTIESADKLINIWDGIDRPWITEGEQK